MRWDQIPLKYFPELEHIYYHFTGPYYNKTIKDRNIYLPAYSLINKPSEKFKDVSVVFGS